MQYLIISKSFKAKHRQTLVGRSMLTVQPQGVTPSLDIIPLLIFQHPLGTGILDQSYISQALKCQEVLGNFLKFNQ